MPADNADKSVIVDRSDAITFHPTMFLPTLEKLAGGENDIGPIADVMFASGYFGDLTPAQIAVHIMAGRSLGLDDAQSVFDLTITPGSSDAGPIVAYRTRQSYIEASDKIEAMKYGQSDGRNDGKIDDDRITPKPALAAVPNRNVVDLPGPFRLDISDIVDSANKGDLSEPAGEVSPKAAAPAETTSAGPIPASAAAIGEDPAAATGPADPFTEPAPLIDPGNSAGATGDDTAAVMLSWRTRIATICDQLDMKPADKAARLKDFDSRNMAKRRDQFDAAETYYEAQLSMKRAIVLTALKLAGKETLDEQKGFFIYAGVPLDPAEWTYTDAINADRQYSAFSQVIDPDAAA